MRIRSWTSVALLLCALAPGVQASPDGYGIDLQSTVGLGPECADDAHLTLPPGNHTVTVCLRATNASDKTLYLHDVVAERLGPLLDGVLYTLPAHESVIYTYPIRLARSAALVSRWISWGLRGRAGCAVAWSLVRVAIPPNANDLDPSDDAVGNPLYYTVPFDTALSCPPPTGS